MYNMEVSWVDFFNSNSNYETFDGREPIAKVVARPIQRDNRRMCTILIATILYPTVREKK